jgi:hypothetical protein
MKNAVMMVVQDPSLDPRAGPGNAGDQSNAGMGSAARA